MRICQPPGPPSPRSKGLPSFDAEARSRARMRDRGSRKDVEHAVQDLGDLVLGDGFEIGVRRAARFFGRQPHAPQDAGNASGMQRAALGA